jgi:SAM-dependent MidA family methyltransferase
MPHWLQPHLDADHRLRFDRFMELALYDPGHGYYAKHITTVGRHGDFSTTTTLSTALGRGIAAAIRKESPDHVLEIGAGTGALTKAVRRALPFLLRRRTRFHIVEHSPVLRSTQQQLLGRKASWHDSVTEALHATGGSAFIFSNELVDAFPPRVFQITPDGWQELFLTLNNGGLRESWQTAHALPDSTMFSQNWPDGQRIEIHESYRSWLADWLPAWSGESLLTIDYGGSPLDIYRRRPAGSLRAYLRHQVLAGPAIYESPGRRDLTADVNFDDLCHWGESLGLRTVALTTQREFLRPHARPTAADRFLTDPDGAGTAFKVLRQSPEIV